MERPLAAATLPDQPYASYWYPNTVPAGGLGQSLLNWTPAADPNAAFNISGVPLATRFTPNQVNPAVANTAAGVMSLSGFGPTSYNPSQGSQTMAYYDPTYWQYQSQLVFWGGSAGEGLILAPNATVIDAAHRNGVPVLGTIFFPPTADGGEINWVNDMLATSTSGGNTIFPIANKLIQVADYYHFDGWFINQETAGGNSATATLMTEFMQYMHAQAPNLTIDWYDAMSSNGGINYQEQLDNSNQQFFQNGSGTANFVSNDFFANYGWTSTNINNSVTLANSLGRSPFSVFAGVNAQSSGTATSISWSSLSTTVSGQNTLKTSLGLFEPNATFSNSTGTTDLARMQSFFGQESQFWTGASGNPSSPGSTSIANYIQAQAVLPSASAASTFVTNFNPGVGQFYAINGQILATGEWNDLSLQDIMPTWRWLNKSSDGGSTKLAPNFDFTQAYYGGASLSVTGNMTAYNNLSLYATQLAVSSSSNLEIAFKDGQAGAASMMQVVLTFSDSSVGYLSCGTTSTVGWNTETFSLGSYAGKTITGIGLQFGSGGTLNNYTMNVGQILVYSGTQSTPAAPTALQELATFNVSSNTATMQLAWTHAVGALSGSGNPTGAVYAYNIFQLSGGSQSFLGATPNNAYFVPAIVRSGTQNFATIEVQTVAADMGMSSNLTQYMYVDWQRPAWTLTWQGNGYGSSGGSGTWSGSALTWHHDGDATATVDQPWSNSWGDTAIFSGSAAGPVIVSGSQSANQIIFNTAGYNLSGGSLFLAGGGAAITVNAAATINSTVDMGGGTVQIGGPRNLALGGTLQNGSLLKTGSGILLLSGANTFSGGASISGGTLQVGDGVANNGSLPGNVSNNAALLFANPAAQVYSGTISGSGSLAKIGTGTLTISTSQNYTGPTVISAGTVRLGPVFVPFSVTGFGGSGAGYTVTTNSNSLYTSNAVPITNNVLTLTDGHNNEARAAFYGVKVPVGSFTASFVYQAAGGSSLADGAAFVLQNSSSGAAALGGNGGSLGFGGTGAITPSAAVTLNIYSGASGGVGSEYVTGGSIGSNASTGSVNLASKDPIQVNLSYDGSNLLVESLKDMTTSATYSTTYAVGSLAGVVSGSTAYIGFTGATGGVNATQSISSFSFNYTVPVAANNILPTTTAVSLAAGATVDLFGGSQTIGSLSGAGTVTNTAASSTSTLTDGGDNSSRTFAGALQNGGGVLALTKTGTGTFLLTGSSSYTGPTTVNQGELTVNGALVSPVTVNSGGILGGTGYLSMVMVNSGGQLSPGDAPGVLTLSGSLVLQPGAMLDYELDTPGTSDEISMPGELLSLNGQQFSNFNFTETANFGPGTYDLISFGSTSGSLGGITSGVIDGDPARLAISGNELVLNVTPEPSTFALLAAGAAVIAGYVLRRRRKVRR